RFLFILLTLLVLPPAGIQAQNGLLTPEKPVQESSRSWSGDNQQQKAGSLLEKPVRVRVTGMSGKPVAGVPVTFEPLSVPAGSEGFRIQPTTSFTDSLGMAFARVTLGDKAGEYTLISRIKNDPSSKLLVFRFTAQKANWVFMLLIGLLGGLGLFLLGMNMMSEGMEKSAGARMRSILGNLTRNRFLALLAGTVVTMIIQSSSATTVMMVSFVNSGLMAFGQTLGVILGAAIGTTITAQLIAFKLTDYALLLVAAGFALYSFSRREKTRHAGEAILGFGILFYGMYIMSEAMAPLRTYAPFLDFVLKLENPLAGIVIGAAFTALIQSSSAFIGIMIVLASQGLLTLEASIPLLLGANIGTAITAILASIRTNREAKRVALAHTLFKIFGVLIVVWWIPEFAKIVQQISPAKSGTDEMNVLSAELPRQIANAHTIFNVFVTLILLPFLNSIGRFITWLLPDRKIAEEAGPGTKYIGDPYNIPSSLAISLAREETIHTAHITLDMVNNYISPFILNERPDVEWMSEKEEEVDFLRDQINDYLMKVMSKNLERNRSNEAFEILYTVKELEQIADLIHTGYLEKAVEWVGNEHEFSEEGKKELTDYHLQVIKQISRAIEVFREFNLEKARHMKEKHHKYRRYAMELEKNHYRRLLNSVDKSVQTSKTHLELMTVLTTVYSHATNIARIILQWSDNYELNDEESWNA
ncbi:MAG TPA: Na/Pi symporter, partial [Bacteroidales bacterium]|nr:Na/Pi symporter [Bacteroidales bacterium]